MIEFQNLVASAVNNGYASAEIGRAEYRVENVENWPILHEVSELVARDVLKNVFGAGNRHVAWHYRRPDPGMALIGVESETADRVIDALADDAKEAADQCTRTRPALIMIQLTEITADDLRTLLQTKSGIHLVAHAVFRSEKRSHVDCVGFSLPASTDNFGATAITGTAAVLHNPSPKMPPSTAIRKLFTADDPTYRISA